MYQVAVYFFNNPSAPGQVHEFATQGEALAFEELMDSPDLLVVYIGYIQPVEEEYLDHHDLKYYDFEDYEPWEDHDGHVVAARSHFMATDQSAHVEEYWAESIPF